MSRACLKIAFYQMCFPICGRFVPNERGVAGYVDRIWGKYAAKRGTQMVGMNFQTRSRTNIRFSLAFSFIITYNICKRTFVCKGGSYVRKLIHK